MSLQKEPSDERRIQMSKCVSSFKFEVNKGKKKKEKKKKKKKEEEEERPGSDLLGFT